MASQKPPQRLDALESMVNDVVVQTAKAIRSSRVDGPRAVPAVSHGQRIQDLHNNFNSVLDDVESELMKAKAILQRDLDLMRAKRRQAVIPEPVMLSQPVMGTAPEAPFPPGPPQLGIVPSPASVPPQPRLQLKQPPSVAAATPNAAPRPPVAKMTAGGAPFPNMGVGHTPQTGPVKMKTESPPKPSPAALNVPGKPPVQKVAPPMVKTASAPGANASAIKKESPGIKHASVATVKTGSPALKTSSPVPPVKKISLVSAPVKPAPKATPPPAAATVPPPQSAKKVAPPPVAAPPPKPQPNPTQPADPLDGIIDLTNPATLQNGAGVIGAGPPPPPSGAAPQLNFTNMQFSLAPPLSATESSNPPGGDTDFDLDSFITDATNNLLTDQFAGGNETGSAAGPPPTTGTTGDPMDTTGEGGDASNKVDVLADLLRLDGPTELSSADADAAGGSSFDDLWIEAGNTNMGEFDSSYFEM
ncbi:hypothetical protein MCOR27_010899 [Pyricularia oryzae]|uniref:Uncharacterized protein n=2 Tax=Pyricularia TaxID=48558 RepID=A0ABQ8N522_PYRGI|nr:hypothetical protein MCOR01_004222 [Pyricularia oryzae]KAI6290564.1 hypothetical protein MCOR33_011216 [Pyricularia grisea]KAI6252784.1 hypothetical protein MCOR19_010629 [Pyricularia oryzae]KAI6264256.1 hypothetical protein MCOR26_011477 [Pyricularia oryzae]KAI6266728.1 hypothetical protein MCOR27_010899 [Pyricularia oryzae]